MEVLPYYHFVLRQGALNVVAELSEKLISLAPTPALRDGRVILPTRARRPTTRVQAGAPTTQRHWQAAEEKGDRAGQGLSRCHRRYGLVVGIPMMHQHFDLPIDGVLRGLPSSLPVCAGRRRPLICHPARRRTGSADPQGRPGHYRRLHRRADPGSGWRDRAAADLL